jgi:hypothetical protein
VRVELGLSELKFRRQILYIQFRWWARMCAFFYIYIARQEMTRGMSVDTYYVALPSSLVAVVHAAERWLGAGFRIIILVN